MGPAEELRNSESLLHGFWSMTGHPAVLDAAASASPDFICVDTQHGAPLDALSTSTFTILASYGVPSLARVEALDEARIGRALDLGADGVVIPLVASADDARRAVAASRYAPGGTRSYGVQTRRVPALGGAVPVCWIQIETAGAMGQLEEIASIDGVDGLYVGPADLGLALVGEPAADVPSVFEGTHPHAEEMETAFDQVVAACRSAGIVAGLHCGTGEAAVIAAQHGFTASAVAADTGLIGAGLTHELDIARSG
jgi:4-hydroxy-2-oxoheptanedioate aldolase